MTASLLTFIQVALHITISTWQLLNLKKMSSEDGGKILTLVQNRIERCLRLYMNQKEVVNTLYIQDNIQPHVTELVWQKLEEENQQFFKAYYLRLMVKEQIMEFNKLLSEQVELMRRLGPAGIAPISMSNGSHIPPMHQNLAACRAAENAGPSLKAENMHHTISANLQNVFSNCESSMQSCVQAAANMPSHTRNVDVCTNMLVTPSSNRGMAHLMDRGMIKSEPGYAGSSSFEFGAHNNLVESCSALGDASVSSFSSVESNSQPLNGTLLDADTSSFGFFGQISQHFDLSDLDADFANGSDLYSSPPFVTTESNFLDHHGDIERLNTVPENLRFQDLGGD
ncbi:hypothetical protein ACH5RR_009104 [Cinchona calisaya]|uniref:Uncharacterized protein n=1 Tax=Cinchona calisaya TaxID=153742 RepID=A0ABD3ADH9_9GENT